MTFGAPWWLLLLALAPLVVLLHMRRRRVVSVPSLRLWRDLARSGEASRPPRSPLTLPLILQLLVLVLASLGLSDPSLDAERHTGVDHWILVLDVSPSMAARRDDENVLARAREALLAEVERDVVARGVRTSVVLTGGGAPRVQVVAAEAAADVRSALASAEVAGGTTDWPAVASIVDGLAAEEGEVRVTVATDGAGWGGFERAARPILDGVEVDAIVLEGPEANAAIHRAFLAPAEEEEGTWRIDGTVVFHGDTAESTTVRLLVRPDGTDSFLEWATAEVASTDGSYATFSFETDLPAPAQLRLEIPGDALPFDDVGYLQLGESDVPRRVLHVGEPNAALRRAVHAMPDAEYYTASEVPEDAADFDLAIVDAGALRHPGTHTVWLGGGAGAGPAADETESASATVAPSSWANLHPLSRGVDWSGLEVPSTSGAARLPGATAVVEALDQPLVQARRTGSGHEILVAFDPSRSNWGSLASFPLFLMNALDWTDYRAHDASLQRTCRVGVPCAFDPRLAVAGARVVGPNGEEVLATPARSTSVNAAGPSGAAPVPLSHFVPEEAGFHAIVSPAGSTTVAVNAVPSAESDPTAPDVLPDRLAVGTGGAATFPLRITCLLLALAVLLAESWTAGVRREGWARPSVWKKRHARSTRARLVSLLRLGAITMLLLAIFALPFVLPERGARLAAIVDRPLLRALGGAERVESVLRRAETSRSVRYVGRVELGPDVLAGEAGEGAAVVEHPRLLAGGSLDFERAFILALGLLGDAEAGRVLLSTRGGSAPDAAHRMVSAVVDGGVVVDVLPVERGPDTEVLVERLVVPDVVTAGARFTVAATAYASVPTSATARIRRNGELWTEEEVELGHGTHQIVFEMREDEPGTVLYEAEIDAPDDVLPQNDFYSERVRVREPSEVAVVAPDGEASSALLEAFDAGGVRTTMLEPESLPVRPNDWLAYDVVVLDNVPALDLHSRQQEGLAAWVREYGGGLLIAAGDEAFGPGGYYQTPLERLSPVSSLVPRETPQVGLVFVLDRSGSMQQAVEDATRLEIAKRATLDALALLGAESAAGIVVFDSEASVLVPMRPVEDVQAFEEALAQLEPGGGTALYPAIVEAYEQLREVDASVRHIVVMSDGLSEPGDFEGIMQDVAEEEITLSTVAIGRGADERPLRALSRAGEGAFHATSDVAALPGILAQETMLLSGTTLSEEPVAVRRRSIDSPLIAGLPGTLPGLAGFVRTTAKPDAEVVLETSEGEPILSTWRHGLGRVSAFTSEAAGPWSSAWVDAPFYASFWEQNLRWLESSALAVGLHVAVERDGDDARIVVEALTGEAGPDRGRTLLAEVERPDGATPSLPLREAQDGVYVAPFSTSLAGDYAVEVFDAAKPRDGAAPLARTTVHVPYAPAFAVSRSAAAAHDLLKMATGGRTLLGDEPLQPEPVPISWTVVTAWRPWVLLALLFFAADLLVRYGRDGALRLRGLGLRHRGRTGARVS